jgi:hypothetical protein
VKGSWTSDLVLRKLWALTELHKIKNIFDTVYILGSWYGNTSIILSLSKNRFKFDHIVNVDRDTTTLDKSDEIIGNLGLKGIESMNADANELDYRQLGSSGLVINTSAGDIEGKDWFKNIPKGTTVLIQARNRADQSPNQFNSVRELIKHYPLTRVFYKGQRSFKDPETEFDSYMIIGQK